MATPLGAGGVEFLRRLPEIWETRAANGSAHAPASSRTPASLLATLEQHYRPGFLRRLDRCAQLALLAATQALEDAGLELPLGKSWGLLVASGNGPTASVQALFASIPPAEDGRLLCSPTAFSNSLHNAAAAHISGAFDIQGPCLTVSQLEESVPAVLELAALLLATQPGLEGVLIGCVDEAAPGDCTGSNPEDTQRTLGEGASFFVCRVGIPRAGEWSVRFHRVDGRTTAPRWAREVHVFGEASTPQAFLSPAEILGTHPTAGALDLALCIALLGNPMPASATVPGPLHPLALALSSAHLAVCVQHLEDGVEFTAAVSRGITPLPCGAARSLPLPPLSALLGQGRTPSPSPR